MSRDNLPSDLKAFLMLPIGILACWLILFVGVKVSIFKWDEKVSLAIFLAVPAVMLVFLQFRAANRVQRASYLRDYALRFRTDRELSETFHYLVYRFGNTAYRLFRKQEQGKDLTEQESAILNTSKGNPADDLKFFDPENLAGAPQERRLDNLLGFFDALAYDYYRGLISLKDVSGVFGLHLDYFAHREVISAYLKNVKDKWPKSEMAKHSAPVPFLYLEGLLKEHNDLRRQKDEDIQKENRK